MLKNEPTLAVVGVDTADNEPCKVCPLSVYRSPIITDPPGTHPSAAELCGSLPGSQLLHTVPHCFSKSSNEPLVAQVAYHFSGMPYSNCDIIATNNS